MVIFLNIVIYYLKLIPVFRNKNIKFFMNKYTVEELIEIPE